MNNTTETHQGNATLLGNLSGETYLMIGASALLVPVILTGNVLVVASYITNHRLHNRMYTFLVSLAVSDFLVGGINLPMWIYCMLEYHKCNIKLFKFFDLFGAFASILHLTAISIERYIAIVKPFVHERLPPIVHRGTIVFIWSFSTLMTSLSWFNYTDLYRQTYNCVVFMAGFVLPATVILSMYVGIFRAAKSLIQRTPSLMVENKKRINEDRKVAVTVAVISGLFITAWLPFFVVSMIASFCRQCLPSNHNDLLRMVAAVKWLHYSNSMVNPIVYALRDTELRNTFLQLLKCKKCLRCRAILRERGIRVSTKTLILGKDSKSTKTKYNDEKEHCSCV